MQLSCIPLRHLRYLRENIHARVLNQLVQMEPNISLADHADNRRQITRLHKLQTVFLCEIMQLSCIPLRHLRYLRENIHARVLNLSAQMKPQ